MYSKYLIKTWGLRVLLVICLILVQNPSDAVSLFHKKDYKQHFINDAINADKRNDLNAAFHSFEKAMYYYKKDKILLEAYASFCERHKYFKKSEELYSKLYILTKDPKYLFKKNLSTIKTGNLTRSELNRLANISGLSAAQKIELNLALIYHFSYKNDWKAVQSACKKIPISKIGKDSIVSCIVASQKVSDNDYLLSLYMRFSDLNPMDSEIVNKVILLAEKSGNYRIQEVYIKKLIAQNPKDLGIRYKLAGFYEKNKQWKNALKVYRDLLVAGDSSEHVKSSLAYVESQLNPSKTEQVSVEKLKVYPPKPLSGYKLQEKLFYDSLDKKDYKVAMSHLQKMLQVNPKNPKLLKHKIDLYFATENYKSAIETFEKLQKIQSLSEDDKLFLAYLYTKENNYSKTFDIMDSLLKLSPNNGKLLGLAADYSAAAKDWDKALSYNERLLKISPDSEKLLKSMGDIYSIKNDFPSAINYYQKLSESYPKIEYKYNLANLYMANQDFISAEQLLAPIYSNYPNQPQILDAYLNSILAQRKTAQAYWLIKQHHLENTKMGYMVFGDMAMMDKQYEKASANYEKALAFEPSDTVLQNKLADSFRMQGYIYGPNQMFKKVLAKDPKNKEARLGLGSLETERKNFDDARAIFSSILEDDPNYRPAKIATAHSYLANGDRLSALRVIDPMLDDDESKLIKGQTYYDMNMWSDAKSSLKGSATKDADDLRYKIRRDDAIRITPLYSFFHQNLSDQYNLNYHKFGLDLSKNVNNNTNVFMDYNVIVYSSGASNYLNNVVNEFRGGVQSRPERQWEYRADIGVKAYEFGGAMLNTDSWIKHYFNDKFALKLGFKRDNIEQSYLAAVGQNINGVFTGRSAYNKVYLEYEGKLPFQIYTYGFGAYGMVTSANLTNNQYFEALVGAGKFLYNNPKNKWVNTCALDIVSYNMGYQYDQLNIPGPAGVTFGGYYSPSYFNATTGNLKIEGNIKKWHLKYGIKAFGGPQSAMSPDQISLAWGWSPYLSYDLNDNIAINASYNHFHYANLMRDVFMVSAVIRGFKKHG